LKSVCRAAREGATEWLRTVELWALVAERSGIVGAWRLPGVCRASRVEGMAANAAAAGGVRRVGHARGRRLLHEGGVEAGSGAASLGADV
jgi:hypothetical protein